MVVELVVVELVVEPVVEPLVEQLTDVDRRRRALVVGGRSVVR